MRYAKLLLTASILLLILSVSVWQLLIRSLPLEDGSISLPGLSANVSVAFDDLAIPSINAAKREDAFMVLGYLHARERLFQMELLRRKSAGRLAEIFGAKLLALDKQQRAYQLTQAAQQIVAALPPAQRQVLEQYVAGVNAYMQQAAQLPPEFLALQLQPEAWRAEDSMLVALSMFQNLNGQEQDERMVTVMSKVLAPNLIQFLTPDTDLYAQALVGGSGSRRPAPPIPVTELAQLAPATLQLAQTGVEVEQQLAGSNNWVVTGKKTADGRAILANDMHLGLAVPNIWYRAQLHYADAELNGVTLPGVPVQIVGSNRDVAWGFTNATADMLDLITLDINPANPDEYRTPDGWRTFTRQTALIKVKDGADVAVEQLATIWGPVSSSLLLGQQVAIKWTALDPAAVNLGMLDMDQVSSVSAALRVLNRAGGPAQNVVFADRQGHIGWSYMGYFPKRKGFDGLVSRSWADARVGWDGYIPADELPRVVDPAAGFIVTANNRTLGSDYPYVLGYNWSVSYRAHRITERLQRAEHITEADMLQLQWDARSEFYDFYQNLALQELQREPQHTALLAESQQALLAWDGTLQADSKGAALLTVWRSKLATALFAGVVKQCQRVEPTFSYAWREMETPLRALLSERPAAVLASEFQQDWHRFLIATLNSAASELQAQHPDTALADLTWGAHNQINQQHPFSKSLPLLAPLLNYGAFPGSGCASVCVNALMAEHGASERMVIAPAHPEAGILQMPGGQSGHPLSSHYQDQQPFWQNGGYAPFLPGKARHTLSFVSAS